MFVIQQIDRKKCNPDSTVQLQDQTVLLNRLPKEAVIDQDEDWIILDAAALYFDSEPSVRFAQTVGSREKRKDYLWADELVRQMRKDLVDFYQNQIGK